MSVRAFDHDFVNETIARLNRIKPDARPLWGNMTRDLMIGHLIRSVKTSMGRGPTYPFVGNWFTRRVVAPLILHGLLPIPKNVKGVEPLVPHQGPLTGDTEALHAVLETYLDLVQSGAISPPQHPVFGDIGVDGWAKLHVLHFEHHLKQFGV